MLNKKISIIIPVYNAEKYLKCCLDSILNQSYKNLEIIIINDGSTDNSLKVIEEYKKNDNRIILISQKNQGVSKSRNNGLELATGDYIMFIDPDDWIELDTCELLSQKMNENYDVIIFNYIKEFKNGKSYNLKYDENYDFSQDSRYNAFMSNLIAPFIKNDMSNYYGLGYATTKIFKRNLAYGLKFSMENIKAYNEDILFYLELFKKTRNIKYYNKYLYHYRIHGEATTFGYNPDFPMVNEITYQMLNQYSKKFKNNLFLQAMYSRMIYNLIKEISNYIFSDKNEMTNKNKMKFLKEEVKKDSFKKSIHEIKLKGLNFHMFLYTLLLKLKMYHLLLFFIKIEKAIKNRR